MSRQLLFDTKTDYVDSDLSWSSSSSERLTQQSWFTVKSMQLKKKKETKIQTTATEMNSPMTSWPLSTSLWHAIMEDAQVKIKERENVHEKAHEATKKRKKTRKANSILRLNEKDQLKQHEKEMEDNETKEEEEDEEEAQAENSHDQNQDTQNAEERIPKSLQKQEQKKSRKRKSPEASTTITSTITNEKKQKQPQRSRKRKAPTDSTTKEKEPERENKKMKASSVAASKQEEDNISMPIQQAQTETERAVVVEEAGKSTINACNETTHVAKKQRKSKWNNSDLRKPVIVDNPDKPPACRMKKFKLKPNANQRQLLRQAFGVLRWTYNQLLNEIKTPKQQPEDVTITTTLPVTLAAFRSFAVNENSPLLQDKPWVKAVPYDLRDEAANDLRKAWKANETKIQKGDKFAINADFKFMSKHRKSQKMVIHRKNYYTRGVFHPDFFGEEPFRSCEKLPDRLDYDSCLTMNWLGDVYLCVPQPLDKFDRAIAPNPIAAIDPGVRTFGTVFDPLNHRFIEWGAKDMGKIVRLCYHLDDLQSRVNQVYKPPEPNPLPDPLLGSGGDDVDATSIPVLTSPEKPIRSGKDLKIKRKRKGKARMKRPPLFRPLKSRQRNRMRKAFRRMSAHIQNLITDFHYKYAKWLCLNYQVILLPFYKTSDMVRRCQRKINNTTVRNMMNWSPCKFRDRLIGMSRRYPGCQVIQLSEAYTSKTCRSCGFVNASSSSKTFKCRAPGCGQTYDRDFGGSSNIFLRYASQLSKHICQNELVEDTNISDVAAFDTAAILGCDDPHSVASECGDADIFRMFLSDLHEIGE